MQEQRHVEEPVVVFSKVKNIKQEGLEDVYCLNVPSHGNFVVNEGVVVKNCMDALRYGLFTHLFGKTAPGMTALERDNMYNEAMGIGNELPAAFQQPMPGRF